MQYIHEPGFVSLHDIHKPGSQHMQDLPRPGFSRCDIHTDRIHERTKIFEDTDHCNILEVHIHWLYTDCTPGIESETIRYRMPILQ